MIALRTVTCVWTSTRGVLAGDVDAVCRQALVEQLRATTPSKVNTSSRSVLGFCDTIPCHTPVPWLMPGLYVHYQYLDFLARRARASTGCSFTVSVDKAGLVSDRRQDRDGRPHAHCVLHHTCMLHCIMCMCIEDTTRGVCPLHVKHYIKRTLCI